METNDLSRTKTTKKKRRTWTTWVGIILLLMIATVGIATLTNFIQEKRHQEATVSVKVNSEQIDSGIYLQTESKESDTFTSFVTYPYTKLENIDIPIYEWVQKQEQMFYDEMETIETMIGDTFHSHFSLYTDIEKINEDLFQIKLTSEQLVEENNQYEEVHTFMIDVANEKIILLDEIIDSEDHGKEGLFSFIYEYLQAENLDDMTEEEILKENVQNKLHWLFDEENLILFFNPGDLGKNEELIELYIPLIDIYKRINENYKSIILSEALEREIGRIEEEEQNEGQSDEEDPLEKMGSKKLVALTFDDGPHENVTKRVLKTLEEYNAKATFFMLGKNAESLPEIARQVANEGHEIANHSISHANLNASGADRIHEEMVESLHQIENATGVRPHLFRPPYGNYNDTVLNKANETNQKLIMWSVDTRDWESRNANSVYQMVQSYTQPGSIILMHDIHPTTADALPQIMEYLSEQGYEFVTVSELLPYINGSGIGPYNGN